MGWHAQVTQNYNLDDFSYTYNYTIKKYNN